MLFGGRRSTVVPLVHRGVRLGARRVPGRHDELGDDRRGRRARWASCASTRSRCCRSAATTWRDYMRHWLEIGRREGAELPRIFYVNWFRKDEGGALPVARLRREQPGARVGVPPLRRRRSRPRRPRSAWCPREGDLNTDGLDIDQADLAEVLRGRRRTSCAQQLPQFRSTWPPSATTCPPRSAPRSTRSSSASASRGPCSLRWTRSGDVAEWLRSGLQSRLHRFDSGRRLYWVCRAFVAGAPT